MYLVGWPDHRTLNVSYLFAFITGYEFCLSTVGRDSELRLFNDWISANRPELGRGSQWFGEVLLQQMGGDHARTIDEIECLARSYQQQASPR
jgi:hypothetical protein